MPEIYPTCPKTRWGPGNLRQGFARNRGFPGTSRASWMWIGCQVRAALDSLQILPLHISPVQPNRELVPSLQIS